MRYFRLACCQAHKKYSPVAALQSVFIIQGSGFTQCQRDIHGSVSIQGSQDAAAEFSGEPQQQPSPGALPVPCLTAKISRSKRNRRRRPVHDNDIKVNSLRDTLEAHRATNLASRIRSVDAPAADNHLRIRPGPEVASPSLEPESIPTGPEPKIKFVEGGVQSGWMTPGVSKPKRIEPERRIELGFPNLKLATKAVSKSSIKPFQLRRRREWKTKTLEYTAHNTFPLPAYRADISHALTAPSPWLERDAVVEAGSFPFHRLRTEILAFHDLMSLDLYEHAAREYLVRKLEALVDRVLPGVRLEVFGSTVTCISQPTSDIDLRIIDPDTETSILKRGPSVRRRQALKLLRDRLITLRDRLRADKGFDNLDLVHARVPIVTGTHWRSGLKIQISGNHDQLTSQEYVKNYLVEYPTLRPLFVIIRQMLEMRGLTEVFAGGLGSYSIFTMIVAFLKLRPPLRTDDFALGRQLRAFLSFYADFNTYNFGLSVEPPMRFDKHPEDGKPTLGLKEAIANDAVLQGRQKINTRNQSQPYLLCLQDPANPHNDLGAKAYAIKHIRQTFSAAHRNLEQCMRIWEEQHPKNKRKPRASNQSQSTSEDSLESESVEFAALERAGLLWPIIGGNYESFEKNRARVRSFGKMMVEESSEEGEQAEDNTSAQEPTPIENDMPTEDDAPTENDMPTEYDMPTEDDMPKEDDAPTADHLSEEVVKDAAKPPA